MFLTQPSGLGQDESRITLRRKTKIGILIILAGFTLTLAVSAFLLYERRGTLLVHADREGACVVLNGSLTTIETGDPIKRLRPDIYSVSVDLPGYQPEPSMEIVRIESGAKVEVSFKLTPIPEEPPNEPTTEESQDNINLALQQRAETPRKKPVQPHSGEDRLSGGEREADKKLKGTLKVITTPVQGGIFIDDVFKGIGKITITDVKLGEIVIRFGEIEGYRNPEPQKAFLTTSWPYASIEGVYLPLIYIATYLDQAGRVIANKCEVNQGYIIGDTEKISDPVAGPGIKQIDEIGTFVWEIGYAFSNRNPAGQDFVELQFDLPENWDGNKSLDLHLYGYASENKYPFALSGKTGIDILINSRKAKDDFQPSNLLTGDAASGLDIFPVNSFLRQGENTIRIQSSASSRCFYYLQQIVLL